MRCGAAHIASESIVLNICIVTALISAIEVFQTKLQQTHGRIFYEDIKFYGQKQLKAETARGSFERFFVSTPEISLTADIS